MSHSFIAYIDESGDDGLNPSRFRKVGKKGGSSHWLTVSAMIMRYKWEPHAITWRNTILDKTRKKTKHLHFADLQHGQKIVACQSIVKMPIRAISVMSNKGSIPDDTYTSPNQLYCYLTRYVIERISWICRDYKRFGEGNGSVKIIFSRRGGMSYEDFRSYLRKLKEMETRIEWPSIDIDNIDAQDHSKNAGLQLADTIASGMSAGLEANEFGNWEWRYAEILKAITYSYRRKYMSYGTKIVPDFRQLQLAEEQLKFINIFK